MSSVRVALMLTMGMTIGPVGPAAAMEVSTPPPLARRQTADSEPPTHAEEDLAEKLIRQATGQSDGGVMGQIQRLMERSAKLLTREFDPGPKTQAAQRQIVAKLDDAIAAAQRNRSRSSSSGQQSSDKRKAKPQAKKRGKQQDGSTAGQGSESTTGGGKADDTRVGADQRFKESRRGWGHLPARDRDEVLQGIGETVLEKYRTLIDRYFRALAEDDDRQTERP